ncbi:MULTISPECIES: hypothetical protein [Arthrobacter]|uniref:Uncharacterized protein n=2 Tax=Arthrobacter TaxID=1663 RepID=A0ABU9KGX2_9MICC|nr:hypothetical protein [Arthrobacter sp. YJM1]MDP5226144.1 hypothetical protein [Arthrobacter sp. YJM1]
MSAREIAVVTGVVGSDEASWWFARSEPLMAHCPDLKAATLNVPLGVAIANAMAKAAETATSRSTTFQSADEITVWPPITQNDATHRPPSLEAPQYG